MKLASRLNAIVAATPSGVIGRDGDMPWHLRQDLQRFKRLTMGGVLLMGRKTFDSIGRPLPGRRTLVITRQGEWSADGVEVAFSPSRALEMADGPSVFVVGGAQIYRELLPFCDQIHLTRVWSAVSGDTRLELDLSGFVTVEQSRIPAGPRDDVPSEYLRMVRANREVAEQKS